MKQVISFLIAALFAAVSVQGFAAEEKKADAKVEKKADKKADAKVEKKDDKKEAPKK